MIKYYQILGISSNSSIEDIKKAYRSLALKFHPDRGGSEEKMKELNEAYEYLINNQEKRFGGLGVVSTGFTIIVGGFEGSWTEEGVVTWKFS